MSPALWLVLACADPRLSDPLAPAQTEIFATLAAKQVPEGEPLVVTVTVRWGREWTPDLGAAVPQVEGLTTALLDERSTTAEQAISVQVWALSGPPGSYVVPPLPVLFAGPGGSERTLASSGLYGDIGDGGPSSDLAPVALAPVPENLPWWPFALAGGLVLLGAGVWWWRRRGTDEDLPPPIPPDVQALQAWDALQADTALDDHARAVALSALFRRYLEAVLPIAATTATSREILAALDLSDGLQQRTRRLLTATDLIKFARKGGGAGLFDALDGDLRAVVDATAPRPEPDDEGADA